MIRGLLLERRGVGVALFRGVAAAIGKAAAGRQIRQRRHDARDFLQSGFADLACMSEAGRAPSRPDV